MHFSCLLQPCHLPCTSCFSHEFSFAGQGSDSYLISFSLPQITFLVTHFNDTRIANSDIRDALLQSISVLVQYKEHVVAFESNASATGIMPAALLSAFDNRFWIPVTNILLRLCKGTGFGSSKSSTHGESCSLVFQVIALEPLVLLMLICTLR